MNIFSKQTVRLFLFLIFIFTYNIKVFSQDKYFTRTGHVYFISHTDIIDIDADNNQVGSFINTKNGEIIFMVLMNAFEFKLALAQEHFNENYVETHKYPKAKFKGNIINFKEIDFNKNGQYQVKIKGILNIHGKSKEIEQSGKIEVKNGKILASANFQIKLKDFDIKIPELVKDKISPIIPIKVNMVYEPYH